MKASIFFALILATLGCKPCQKAIKPENCDTELRKEIATNWKRCEGKYWNPEVSFWRNDEFANSLQGKFSNCIIGKSRQEILELFGKTLYNQERQVIYDCVEDEMKADEHPICLRFWMDESGKVQKILYDYCWGHQ